MKLVLKNNYIARTEADDACNMCACLMQCLGNRKCNSASYFSADDACAAYPVKLGRLAERSDKIGNALALGFEAELLVVLPTI